MKWNVFSFLVTVAVVAAVGFAVAGCLNQLPPENGGINGVLTVTGIPSQYNGKWAGAEMWDGSYLYVGGAQTVNNNNGNITFPRITDGKVSIPLWTYDGKGWSGNVSMMVRVSIMGTGSANIYGDLPDIGGADFDSVGFKNGNATVDWANRLIWP